MLIAEELEVDVGKVSIEHSPPDDKVLCESAHRRAADRRLHRRAWHVCATAPRRRNARVMLVTALRSAGKSILRPAARQTVRSCTCRAVASLDTAHCRCGREVARARNVVLKAAEPVQADRHPASPSRRHGQVNGMCEFGIDTVFRE